MLLTIVTSDWSRIQVAEGRRLTSQVIKVTHKLGDSWYFYFLYVLSIFSKYFEINTLYGEAI